MPKNSHQNKYNILVVILSLEIGGMEQVVADLVKHVNQERFNTVVACLKSLGPIAAELADCGIRVVQVQRMTSLWSFVYPRNLIAMMQNYSLDVVHVHSGCWHKAALAARLCGIDNVIYTEHGRFFPDSKTLMFLDRLYSPLTKHVVAVSDYLSDYMSSVVHVPKRKISVILNGVDVERFRIARCTPFKSDGLHIGIIARLVPVKDITTLIRAMAIVHNHDPTLVLFIIGDGPERSDLESLVNKLGLSSIITFRGYLRDIPEVLKDIDIFALSSLSEGTSITLLEAMASGKPVVATNVGGNPAIIEEGINGFLVPPREPEDLARALLKLAADSAMRQSMAEANINKITKHYSVEAMTCHYENLYQGLPC
jgi:L-malate glycosyltransferase